MPALNSRVCWRIDILMAQCLKCLSLWNWFWILCYKQDDNLNGRKYQLKVVLNTRCAELTLINLTCPVLPTHKKHFNLFISQSSRFFLCRNHITQVLKKQWFGKLINLNVSKDKTNANMGTHLKRESRLKRNQIHLLPLKLTPLFSISSKVLSRLSEVPGKQAFFCIIVLGNPSALRRKDKLHFWI